MEKQGYQPEDYNLGQPEQFRPEKITAKQPNQEELRSNSEETEKRERRDRRRGLRPLIKDLRALIVAGFIVASGPCQAGAEPGKPEKAVEQMETEKDFNKMWQTALEQGIEEFKNNQTLIESIDQTGAQELIAILRDFDVDRYIEALAKVGGIEDKKDIGGEVSSFKLSPAGDKGLMASVTNLRDIELYIGEWMKYKNKFHGPTIQAAIAHELAHIFSCDYQAPPNESFPLIYTKKVKNAYNTMRLPLGAYEGATELVAICGCSESEMSRGLEQGYRGGGVLSAFALSELADRKKFIEAYLRKDPEILGKLLNDKYGPDTAGDLTDPIVCGISIINPYYQESLDVLHNIYAYQKAKGYNVEKILSKAWKSGIKERAEHFDEDGISLTTHLYLINDVDEPPHFCLNGGGTGPLVYRFGKIRDEYNNFALERLGFVMIGKKIKPETRELAIQNAVNMLKERCNVADANAASLIDAYLYLGIDDYLEEQLKKISEVDTRSSEFERIWADINRHVKELVRENLQEVYEKAGVLDLIYNSDK